MNRGLRNQFNSTDGAPGGAARASTARNIRTTHPCRSDKERCGLTSLCWWLAPGLSRHCDGRMGPGLRAVLCLACSAQARPLHNPNSVDGVKLPIQHGTSSVSRPDWFPGAWATRPALGSVHTLHPPDAMSRVHSSELNRPLVRALLHAASGRVALPAIPPVAAPYRGPHGDQIRYQQSRSRLRIDGNLEQ